MVSSFDQRKQAILSKQDKSFIGEWDKKIIDLCEKINQLDNYYTTSSCAGRVAIIKDKKERDNVFHWVSHDLISFEELKEILRKIINNKKGLVGGKVNSKRDLNVSSSMVISRRGQNYKFKQEPCILHVACKDLKGAEILLRKAQLAGWKRSGIISSGKRFVCELIGTDKLEFPIVENGKILIDDDFFKVVVKKSNENLERSWGKIGNLEKFL